LNFNLKEVCVYFVDFGEQQTIALTNIRPLPQEFTRQPAFAIPCRLYDICPLNGTEHSTWNLDDPVHYECKSLMSDVMHCKVLDIKEQICYIIQVDIPNE
ncbi:unnamed protein product, partial [Adineta steineri]